MFENSLMFAMSNSNYSCSLTIFQKFRIESHK